MGRTPPAVPKRGGRGGGSTGGAKAKAKPKSKGSSPSAASTASATAAAASKQDNQGALAPVRDGEPNRAVPQAARRRSSGVRRDRGGAGAKAVDREIIKLQADHNYLSFPRLAFGRLVRDLQEQFTEEPYRWSIEALSVFQQAAEEYLMYLYNDAYLTTTHRRRVTLNTEDVRLVRRLRQPHCWGETT
uniref:Histone H3.2 n=1 Tax=Crypthecodinium cohnii TaxID=2866 RepID=A0A8K2AUT6_CRYCO|nr:histone H3.2 [Crypthecodinium cohnii]